MMYNIARVPHLGVLAMYMMSGCSHLVKQHQINTKITASPPAVIAAPRADQTQTVPALTH